MQAAATLNGALRRVPPGAVYLAGLVPLGWILWLGFNDGLGVDPVKEIEHRLGKIALWLIAGGLSVTPLRRFAGVNLIRYRRAIGLLAFAYVLLHLAVWAVLDMGMLWDQTLRDIAKRPYLTLGMGAVVLLVPLALTSNDAAVRRLGAARWRTLHRLTYPAAALAAVHYVWQGKVWMPEALIWGAAILALLGLRLRR